MRIPLKRQNKSRKDCFCTAGICKFTVVFKLKIYNLQMFSRPSDIKCSFVSSNFVLFRIIRTAEVYSEHSRTSTVKLFAKIVKGSQLLTIFIKKLYLRYSTRLLNGKLCCVFCFFKFI